MVNSIAWRASRQDRQFSRETRDGHPDKKASPTEVFFVMHYTVYIIFSISCKKFYTGHTQNFDNRLSEHNNGETKSIKSCIPWTLCIRYNKSRKKFYTSHAQDFAKLHCAMQVGMVWILLNSWEYYTYTQAIHTFMRV
ncbi:MAG: GIY-YIG nuclease family protein [Cyclobacteriaceae bacterium]|nr:GIY-YIG nuclease family protein [Cyclobacteriaceae bacterium]